MGIFLLKYFLMFHCVVIVQYY